MAWFNFRRSTASPSRLLATGGLLLAVAASSLPCATPADAQAWPYNGRMPDVGAMAYDLKMRQGQSGSAVRMTGYASSRGGMVRWVHCLQQRMSPTRTCQLMVDNNHSNTFPLPPEADLEGWMQMASGYGWVDRMAPDSGFSSSFQSGGSFSVGDWNASGTFRYWR